MNGTRTAAARATPLALLGAFLAAPACAQPAADGNVLQIDLATALRLADERNLDVAIYVQRTAEAAARLAQARALGIPALRVGASYNRHDGNLQETGGNVVEADRTARFSGLGAGAVGAGDLQTPGVALAVDVADAIFRPLVARRDLEAVRAAGTANRHAVLMDVSAAYIALLRARAETRIALEAAQRAAELATLTADYAEAGEGLRADAEMAAVQPILWEQRRLAVSERTESAAAQLARLLHLDLDVALEPLEDDVPLVEIYGDAETTADLVARALDGRPETEQLDALLAAAESDLDAQRYGWFIPNVTLAYSSGTFGGGPGETIANDDHRDDLTLQLYWQLDAFGVGNRARADEKRAQLRRIGLEREKLRDAIAAEVRTSHARVRSLRRQLELSTSTVDRAREAYNLQRDRIYDQQGLPLEALAAMQTLATAELAGVELRAAYSLAQIQLHTALGNPVDTAQP
jgi:outer membrane protein TolC